MDKKTIYHTIEWLIALAACAYLIYRLVIFDDYASLWTSLAGMSWSQIAALILCIALMPVNMSLEAWRWRTLLPMSWREAHRQVYYSKLAGLITPWRLGEYPARAILRNEWTQTLSMGAVGSATMTFAIIIAGLISLGLLGILGSLDPLVTGSLPRPRRPSPPAPRALLCTATLTSLGKGVPPPHYHLYPAKPRSPCLLVRPTLLSPFCPRRNLQSSICNLQFTHLLSPRHHHAERPDRRSRRTRRMGHPRLWIDERRPRRSTTLGNKYPLTLPYLAFFEEK